MPDPIPSYGALNVVSGILKGLGVIATAIGVLAIPLAIFSPEALPAGLAALAYGIATLALAALLDAIRDIAINSWRQRALLESMAANRPAP